MRRAIARGRMFPQSYSTDRRYGRLSLKAIGLFPLMWANADDQGRLCGDHEEIKYAVCPNIDHITKQDIPGLLQELQDNKLILCYDTPKSAAIQMLDWWDANQKMQWAWPSDYQPPGGWQDHLRYKKDAKTVFTQNWPVSGERSGENNIIAQVSTQVSNNNSSGEHSGETGEMSPLTTLQEKEKERVKRRGRGRGNSPETSGENPSPSPTDSQNRIFNDLIQAYRKRWGRVQASDPEEVIPREPGARILAQLRDLAKELEQNDCPAAYIYKAFDEAAGQQKFHISYVRAILLDWLGLPRSPP